jgi:Family of unknown function (DUF6364)
MDTKLTLKLDQKAIDRAKRYARQRGVSLSRVVETYFLNLTEPRPKPAPPTGLVAELAGILAGKEIDVSKESFAAHLAKKHS